VPSLSEEAVKTEESTVKTASLAFLEDDADNEVEVEMLSVRRGSSSPMSLKKDKPCSVSTLFQPACEERGVLVLGAVASGEALGD